MGSRTHAALLATAAFTYASPGLAQDAPPAATATDVPVTAKSNAGLSVYVPADFQRFAPRNAWDMLTRVPGFSIKESQERRGLGQATGNVLFNGTRPSNKSDDLYTQLTRIPAGTIERIEVLDGATLDIPGLNGQVANVVYKAKGSTGQFEWEPAARAHYADALYTRGNVSVSGSRGTVGYEFSLNNQGAGRSAAGGPTLIRDGVGIVTERRRDVWTSNHDEPKLSARFTWDGPGSSVGHLNGNYQKIWHHYRETSGRFDSPVLPDRRRTIRENNDTWNFEISGDYEFALGPGRLKLVGLENRSHEPFSSEVIDRPVSSQTGASGDRFAQVGELEETIARAEYTWKMLGGDWQLSGEAAYNTLDNVATLGTFDPVSGNFVLRPFAEGTGGVKEDRYESLLSVGFPLSRTLSLQMVAGGEHSKISQTGPGGITRTFDRPKGSISMAWKPSTDFDLSVKLERRVLQLDFYDFLARSFLNDNNQNASNTDLRPQQDWSWTAEMNKKLGPWGSTKLELIHRSVTDRVDIIPVGTSGEAVGNIDKARAWAVVSTSTINFDPIGWKGARLDASIVYQQSSLKDPFTGRRRNWNDFVDKQVELNFRHDIPASNWAWGSDLTYNHQQAGYRRSQSDRIWEGPVFAALFIENKNVMGLTMRFTVDNVVNARSRRERVIYQGVRELSPVASTESRDRLIGPIFIFLVKGSL